MRLYIQPWVCETADWVSPLSVSLQDRSLRKAPRRDRGRDETAFRRYVARLQGEGAANDGGDLGRRGQRRRAGRGRGDGVGHVSVRGHAQDGCLRGSGITPVNNGWCSGKRPAALEGRGARLCHFGPNETSHTTQPWLQKKDKETRKALSG
ncbi:hypothetical protein AAFF_G00352530 [Aldrovandia affinis]|uniref:Uncharacterized protein n=1 Tax=Aldrovandia affinis TaxID=143900 RepID=A0AAD7WNE2_9TELE|nr:hypothetical protein AAFF_G00352530 [Aldrovandia affinis]